MSSAQKEAVAVEERMELSNFSCQLDRTDWREVRGTLWGKCLTP